LSVGIFILRMELSAFERVLLVITGALVVHRYITGEWYVGIEVEQVEQ